VSQSTNAESLTVKDTMISLNPNNYVSKVLPPVLPLMESEFDPSLSIKILNYYFDGP
jgi:hypothetical protein